MPLVFVHGVANRISGELQAASEQRDAYFRRYLLQPPLWPDPGQVRIRNPYWGDLGAKAAWGGASVPRLDDDVEALGGSEAGEVLADALEEYCPEQAPPQALLVATARVSLVDAVNLLWAGTVTGKGAGLGPSEADALAELSASALAYAARVPRPDWLDSVRDDEQFVNGLRDALDSEWTAAEPGGADDADADTETETETETETDWEVLGDSASWGRLQAGVQRIRSAAVNRIARPSAEKLRAKLTPKLTDFLGDVLVYLSERPQPVEGTRQGGGEIADALAGVLRSAYAERRDDDPLVVIAHSMGGNIVHDVLTRHPDTQGISVDILVTVGSQVGFFEELSLFGRHPGVPGPTAVRLPRPSAVRRWINIFDYNDLLSFRLAPIIDGVEDCEFRTGKLSAHGAYFLQPGFHARLAERVRQGR
ncbi:hypothetical protein [Streptacidiphilus sp. EB129]|uniref:hypothetical protein n=1 Tax=Streptacidiphilus sp. EB129 TaxID=3156262 RepID=UPI003512FF32